MASRSPMGSTAGPRPVGRNVVSETIEETDRLKAELSRSYGLALIQGWRWIKRGESPAVASLHANGHRFVARLFTDEAAAQKAEYVARFILHLRSVGVEVEEAVRTASGEPSARFPSGVAVVLSRFHAAPPHAPAARSRRGTRLGTLRLRVA